LLEQRPTAFGSGDPRHSGEDAPTQNEQGEKGQRGTGVAEVAHREGADFEAEDAARADRQRRRMRVETQRFEPAAGAKEDEETAQRDQQRAAVARLPAIQTAVTPPDESKQQDNPPPGRKTENGQQQIGQPAADRPARRRYGRPGCAGSAHARRATSRGRPGGSPRAKARENRR